MTTATSTTSAHDVPGRAVGLRGRFLGFDVYVPWWSLAISCAAVVWAYFELTDDTADTVTRQREAIAFVFLLCISIAVHELGHAFAARRLGVEVGRITISPLGGMTEIELDAARPRQQALIALAGPAVNGILAAETWVSLRFFWSDASASATFHELHTFLFINTVLLVVNLAPILPLDGGRVVQALLWRATGRRGWATMLTAAGGLSLAAVVMANRIAHLRVRSAVDVINIALDFIPVLFVCFLAGLHLLDGWRNRTAREADRSTAVPMDVTRAVRQ